MIEPEDQHSQGVPKVPESKDWELTRLAAIEVLLRLLQSQYGSLLAKSTLAY